MDIDKLISIFTEAIEKDIEWHLEHPVTNLSKDFQDGFNAGLNQAKYLCESSEEIAEAACLDMFADESD